MTKIKNILNKWFSKKPKLLGYENCELKKNKRVCRYYTNFSSKRIQ